MNPLPNSNSAEGGKRPGVEMFPIRWQGKVTGPFALEEIDRHLASNKIGMLHEIQYEGAWISLRKFKEVRQAREQAHRARIVEEKRAAEKAAQEQARRNTEELERQRISEARRQDRLLEEQHRQQLSKHREQPPAPVASSGPSGLQTFGGLLLVAGVLVAGYFVTMFDQTVESGFGRVNNFGLMADRQNGIFVGLGLGVVGTIMLVLGNRNKV